MNNFEPQRVQYLALFISFIFLFFVVRLIIRGKLREEYAFFFLVLSLGLFIASSIRGVYDTLGNYLGVYEPINLIFAGLIILCFSYFLFLSVVSSSQKDKIKKLTQEIAILKNKTHYLKK